MASSASKASKASTVCLPDDLRARIAKTLTPTDIAIARIAHPIFRSFFEKGKLDEHERLVRAADIGMLHIRDKGDGLLTVFYDLPNTSRQLNAMFQQFGQWQVVMDTSVTSRKLLDRIFEQSNMYPIESRREIKYVRYQHYRIDTWTESGIPVLKSEVSNPDFPKGPVRFVTRE